MVFALIPYFEMPEFHLGPFTLRAWGVLVAAGFMLGFFIADKRTRRLGLDPEKTGALGMWIMVSSLIFARLGHCFFYKPLYYIENPLEILMVWHGGMSSFGGFLGAVIGAVSFTYKHKVSLKQYGDVIAFAFIPGWAVGRIGCFLVHDHPGRLSDFFLAVDFPNGPRHDMGLYESLFSFAVAALFFLLDGKKRKEGFYLALLPLLYGIGRFFLDFLRAADLADSDVRYSGLTPGQWGSIMLAICGLFLLLRSKNRDQQ
ncbi:MAG: prolipoprotein diacylglyceryl transferase [Deltaproteobacteria bacterium]|nr:prolipoprotein diacylglyceryl transferase [Deltaproteobacteria bacterium]